MDTYQYIYIHIYMYIYIYIYIMARVLASGLRDRVSIPG